MTKTFIDLLLELPADPTLRSLVEAHGLPLPPSMIWTDTPQMSDALIEAIRFWDDDEARDRLIAGLTSGTQLCEPAGKQAMVMATAGDASASQGLAACRSDMHRSLWLYVHHPRLFGLACDFDYIERNESRSLQHDIGVTIRPDTSEAPMRGLRTAVAGFYQRELQCGDRSAAYLVERRPGIFLLTVHVKDAATLRLEFDGDHLARRVGNPNIHMMLEYACATGVVRTVVRGGAKYHRMLADAFAEHLLGAKVDARLLRPQALDLTRLRQGVHIPQAVVDGFAALQVKSISLLSPTGTIKLDCTATAAGGQSCITDLLRHQFPKECPLNQGWNVSAATLNLYYAREPGKARAKVVTVEVTSRGRLNLNKFDARLQAQLEGYLATLGVLQPDQRLHALASDAGEMVSTETGTEVAHACA